MDGRKISRRAAVLGGLALLATGCSSAMQYGFSGRGPAPRYWRKRVPYTGSERPGTIVVDTNEHYLYSVEDGGWATRYGVGVGEQGLTLKGTATVGHKAEWPSWRPTDEMIKRKPRLAQYANGVPGGLNNPLGAAALYLYRDGRDTMFRIHGTNEPWTIGQNVSSGCIRMTNDNIVDLYQNIPVGTPVLII